MKRSLRRKQILEAAKRVFARKGYHSTGVADIIQECGIARGTFYLYFDSKRDIFETLLDDFLQHLSDLVEVVDKEAGVEEMISQIRRNVRRVLNAFKENPELTRLVLNEAVGLDKGFDEKLDRFYQGLIELVRSSLELGQKMGIIRKLDAVVTAASIIGSVKEVVLRLLHGRLDVDLENITGQLLSYHLRALLTPDILTDPSALAALNGKVG